MLSNDISLGILIVSYDRAEELWNPFFACVEKFYPCRSFKIYLLTQNFNCQEILHFCEVINIKSKDHECLYRINQALSLLTEQYILLIPDDYFFCDNVLESDIKELVYIMMKKNINAMKIDLKKSKKKYLKEISLDSPFILSGGVLTIYEKNFLKRISDLFITCTLRQFEVAASNYIRKNAIHSNIYMACGYHVGTMHCVLEGVWLRKPVSFLQHHNIAIRYGTYRCPSFFHSIRAMLKAAIFHIIIHFPKCYNLYASRKYAKNLFT